MPTQATRQKRLAAGQPGNRPFVAWIATADVTHFTIRNFVARSADTL
jgi:hypothetical protein